METTASSLTTLPGTVDTVISTSAQVGICASDDSDS